MSDFFAGFKSFLLRGNLVELAVAFVMAAAFVAVVNAFVTYIITPIIALIFGEPSVGNIEITINDAVFEIGAFVDSLIVFLTIAAAVYFFVVLPYTKLTDRMKRGEESDPNTKVCPECVSTIPVEARRCPYCTTQLATA